MNNFHVAGDKYLMPLGIVVFHKRLSALKAFLLLHTLGGAHKTQRKCIFNKNSANTRGSEWSVRPTGDHMLLGERVLK